MNKNKASQSLDEIDRKILRLLRENAHMTTQEVADKVGLSQTPCWSRIKRLEDSGVIAGYVALLDPEKIGRPLSVIVEVNLDHFDGECLAKIIEVRGLVDIKEVILICLFNLFFHLSTILGGVIKEIGLTFAKDLHFDKVFVTCRIHSACTYLRRRPRPRLRPIPQRINLLAHRAR